MAKDQRAAHSLTTTSVRLLFFQTAIYVKRFLALMQKVRSPHTSQQRTEQINCIMAYIKTYHYINFEEMYQRFDREHLTLLSSEFDHLRKSQNLEDLFGENYEMCSYLN